MNIHYTKHDVTDEDIQSVERALRSNSLTNGPFVKEFEDNFKRYVGSEYAIAVSSGTAALHLAIAALGVPSGKTVLTPSLTFAATANAAIYCGAKIEFVDIDPETLLLDLDSVESKLTADPDKYAGVIAVDFAGLPVDIVRLSAICKQNNVWLVEDAAHAVGAILSDGAKEIMTGSGEYTDATVFSFHPAKHITTGEGGMITTNNSVLNDKIRLLRSHAMDRSGDQSQEEGWHYEISELGYNYRMSDINAALGNSHLENIGITLPNENAAQQHAYHLYVIQVDERKQLYDNLKELSIFPQVHYVPLHMQPLYAHFKSDTPLIHTENYYRRCLSIPMYPTLSEEEQDYVIAAIKEFTPAI